MQYYQSTTELQSQPTINHIKKQQTIHYQIFKKKLTLGGTYWCKSMVPHGIWEAEARQSIQSYPQLYSELETNIGYAITYLKKENMNK